MKTSLSLLAAMALVACAPASPARAPSATADHYLDQFIDTTANPRDDFWQYSVGKWLKEHPIPKSERAWGVYDVIQEETYNRLSDISKNAATKPGAKGASGQKIGDFWSTAMDTVAIAKQGMT